ncbi:hypothetical protein ACPPVO_34830 [Dactylosporangium sp. McL0621]|uniref:hypothetical protein n=1 Tax=Dactylosporangium sp. McL0621 TaxID=3415678 RepID=UPI003CF9BD63
MRTLGWWTGIFVTILGAAGFAVAVSSKHRSEALWPVWATLAVGLCIAAGLVAAHGLRSWHDLSREQPLPWRTTVLPTAAMGIGVLLVLAAGELFAEHPGSGWRGDVLVVLALTGGSFAGAAMFGVRTAAATRAVPSGEDIVGFEADILQLIALRRLLQRLSSGLGSLVALSTLALGAGVLLSKNLPRELVVTFGAGGSALVGLFYAPAAAAIRGRGERLANLIFAITKPDDVAELIDQIERRSKLEQLMGLDRTLLGDLQSAIPILGPLIAAAAIFLPK